jgi:hypothetical protein
MQGIEGLAKPTLLVGRPRVDDIIEGTMSTGG